MNRLNEIDHQWLVAINSWHSEWADTLMWIVSGKLTWLPLYVLLVGLIVWKFRYPTAVATNWLSRIPACIWIFLAFGLAVGLSDYISSGIIKHWVCRPRPTHEPMLEGLLHIVRDYRGGHYGFVSSHAANTISCALLFGLVWRRRPGGEKKKNHLVWWLLMLWVVLNCYSRMYLGVHYPGDIVGGLIVGAVMALVAYTLLHRLGALDPRGEQLSSPVASYRKAVAGDEGQD